MIHTDIPTQTDILRLVNSREPASISIFLETSPIPAQNESAPVEFTNLAKNAIDQLATAGFEKRVIEEVEEQIDDLLTDVPFWRHLSHSLAVFVTPTSVRTFRLPNRLKNMVEVSDRFHIKPLLRAVTFPQTAFVLALSQKTARLVEVAADAPAHTLNIPNIPESLLRDGAIDSRSGRFWSGHEQGDEGKKVYIRQYGRAVDSALRPILVGREVPLILAAAEPVASIFRSVNSYPHLTEHGIDGNPEELTDAQLDARVRPILDEVYAGQLAAVRAHFEDLVSSGRTETDVSAVARAATYGSIETLLFDMDEVLPGTVDEESGAITLNEVDDAVNYGVIDEIVRRALLSGAKVLAVRREDLPRESPVAAILRFAQVR
ncbi:baeRF11 domain-containing protein [Mycetocola spongiae]|uniref:baeRF11 domain-containing protein n=1 Tax=Mycetocola spongiae TaxID=2859226 RepID=UPI001CF41279|nr:hypothetical protein [Mycetocola spongiae]UCR88040.1 hypothetical protein KXZ72_08470 [Mycetocola spongiae]